MHGSKGSDWVHDERTRPGQKGTLTPSVCGWLVPDDNTGTATASSVMPIITGDLVDSDAATTGEMPTVGEATTVPGVTTKGEEKSAEIPASSLPAPPPRKCDC